jgi:phage protein D
MTDRQLFASAAPVVKVGGQVQGALARDLLRLEVEERIGGLRTLAMHVVATAPQQTATADVAEWLDGKVLDFGKELSVSAGPPGDEHEVFAGKLSALEVNFDEGDVPHVTVMAEDALMALRMTQRSRTYQDKSDGDMARQIAGDHGLTPDITVDGPTYKAVQQANESDLAFLRRRLALVAAELWATGMTLHAATRDQRRGPDVTLTQGSNLLSASVCADLAHQASEVHVSGFDAARRESIDQSAPASTVQAETNGGRTGPQTLTRALGSLPGRRSRLGPLTDGEATAWARAEMLRRSRSFVTVRGTTAGTPALTVGARVTLARCGAPFDGPGYYVTRVRHTFDLKQGLRTQFDAERPTVNKTRS